MSGFSWLSAPIERTFGVEDEALVCLARLWRPRSAWLCARVCAPRVAQRAAGRRAPSAPPVAGARACALPAGLLVRAGPGGGMGDNNNGMSDDGGDLERKPLKSSPDRLHEVMKNAFHTGAYADCALQAPDSDRVHRLHKVVLCQHSPVFESLLSKHFLEGQDADLPIVLGETTARVVNAGLAFIYGYSWEPSDDIELALGLWEFGHRFDIAALESEARFVAQSLADVDSCFEVLCAARTLDDAETRAKMVDLIACVLDEALFSTWFGNLTLEELKSVLTLTETGNMAARGVQYYRMSREDSEDDDDEDSEDMVDSRDEAHCEEIIFNAISVWVKADTGARAQHMDVLLEHLNLSDDLPMNIIVYNMARRSPLNTAPAFVEKLAQVLNREHRHRMALERKLAKTKVASKTPRERGLKMGSRTVYM